MTLNRSKKWAVAGLLAAVGLPMFVAASGARAQTNYEDSDWCGTGHSLDHWWLHRKLGDPPPIELFTEIRGLTIGETLMGGSYDPQTGGMFIVSKSGMIRKVDLATGVAVGWGPIPAFTDDYPCGNDLRWRFPPPPPPPMGGQVEWVFARPDGSLTKAIFLSESPGVQEVRLPSPAYAQGDAGFGTQPRLVALSADPMDFSGRGLQPMLGIEANRDALVVVDLATGRLTTIGPLGMDVGDRTQFDIKPNGQALMVISGPFPQPWRYYDVQLFTGRATPTGEQPGDVGELHALTSIPKSLPKPCYANINGDRDAAGRPILDVRDFALFQNKFATGDPLADCDANAVLDIRDFSCFQNAFALGCR